MSTVRRSRTRTTVWNVWFHYAAILTILVSGILLVPLYLRFIPVETYGAWLATGNVLAWLTLVDPGLSTVLMQRVATAYGRENNDEVEALITCGVVISACLGVIVALVGLGIAPSAVSWIDRSAVSANDEVVQAFRLAVLGTALTVAAYGIVAANQGLQSSLGTGLVHLCSNLAGIVGSVLLLYEGFGVVALGAAVLIRATGYSLGNLGYLLWRLRADMPRFSPSLGKVTELLHLMRFQALGQIGGVLATQVDMFLVARFLGVEVVPLLVLTRRAPETLRMLVERPSMAVMPSIAHMAEPSVRARRKDVLLRLLNIVVWGGAALSGGCVVFNEAFIRLWVGAQMYAGFETNLVICIVVALSVWGRTLANLCIAFGEFRTINVAMLSESLMFVALLLVCVQMFGLIGVPLAQLGAGCLVSAWYFPRLLHKLLDLESRDWEIVASEGVKAILVAFIVCAFTWQTRAFGWLDFILDCGIFIALYVSGMFVASSQFRSEVRVVIQIVARRRR